METPRSFPDPSPANSVRTTSPTNSIVNGGNTTTTAKRRRGSATGSRGVANLTPEQLAKKRANDREAQRAIRERTKGQIENLERRIQELTSQQPYQELQNAIRQRDLAQAEVGISIVARLFTLCFTAQRVLQIKVANS